MAQEDTAHSSASKGAGPAKVLLVDDDNAVRFSLGKIASATTKID
jgi:hypothetical protein